MDVDTMPLRSEIELWDRNTIWSNFPEVSYAEMMESDSGLRQWLDIFYKVRIKYKNKRENSLQKLLLRSWP